MDKTKAIAKFKGAAKTDFNVLGPAKTIAGSIGLITRLRTKHKQSWREIVALFNHAMRDLDGPEASATTICRLYHLERKRIEQRERELNSGIVTAPSIHAAAPPVDIASPAAVIPVRGAEPSDRLATSDSRPRDGPRPGTQDAEHSNDSSALPSTKEILAEARGITEFKNQAKRKT